jgi:ABC-type sugar transport system ATPase subunit
VSGLVLDGVRADYGGVPALQGVDLEVGTGELVAVLGPSGSGKSSLLRVVAGLLRPSAGRVVVRGVDVTGLRPGLRNVSMVFQNYALFPHLDVLANIAFGLAVRGVPKTEAGVRARDAAAVVGLTGVLGRRPEELSGGERQRVALARAIVREPDVYLLDEPLSNLDAELRVRTRDELKTLHGRVGARARRARLRGYRSLR